MNRTLKETLRHLRAGLKSAELVQARSEWTGLYRFPIPAALEYAETTPDVYPSVLELCPPAKGLADRAQPDDPPVSCEDPPVARRNVNHPPPDRPVSWPNYTPGVERFLKISFGTGLATRSSDLELFRHVSTASARVRHGEKRADVSSSLRGVGAKEAQHLGPF